MFEVLDVAVTVFAFQSVAGKPRFREKSKLKLRFWWMCECAQKLSKPFQVCGMAQIC